MKTRTCVINYLKMRSDAHRIDSNNFQEYVSSDSVMIQVTRPLGFMVKPTIISNHDQVEIHEELEQDRSRPNLLF